VADRHATSRGGTMTTTTVRIAGHTDDLDIDGFELTSARRALAVLKARIGRARMLELIADDITDGDAFIHDALARSDGRQATGTTTLRIVGLDARTFGAWLAGSFDREDVMLAAHPEHYVIHNEGPGRAHIVETLDGHVCSFFMGGWDESEEHDDTVDAAAHRSRTALSDGTVFGSVATLFRDTDDGFEAVLSVTLPAACAPAAIDQHLEHFAVEFRSWILRAAAETAA
jgi:hypothetical protein